MRAFRSSINIQSISGPFFSCGVQTNANYVHLLSCSVVLRDAQAELDDKRMYRLSKEEDQGKRGTPQAHRRVYRLTHAWALV